MNVVWQAVQLETTVCFLEIEIYLDEIETLREKSFLRSQHQL